MASTFDTFLFGDNRIATATSGRSKYGHTFGGPHDRRGTAREACNGILIHLLHRLDLTDPAIPFTIPGVRWLPLYYCFDFRANDLGYRLISDEVLITWFPEDDANVSRDESWPDEDDYPLEFPTSNIKIAARDRQAHEARSSSCKEASCRTHGRAWTRRSRDRQGLRRGVVQPLHAREA